MTFKLILLFIVRLWSLQSFTAVVCFKGHVYPVWGVEFRYKDDFSTHIKSSISFYLVYFIVLWIIISPAALLIVLLKSGSQNKFNQLEYCQVIVVM